jgi:hypothetical protein
MANRARFARVNPSPLPHLSDLRAVRTRRDNSLIDIRPAADNGGMEILRDDVRTAVRAVVDDWVELR